MQKIIAAFDGLRFSAATKAYALQMTKLMDAHLVGVFLEDFTRHSYSVADINEYAGGVDAQLKQLNQQDQDRRTAAVQYFDKECAEAGVQHTIHRDRNVALHELLHESIYADLLIINSAETLTRFEELPPSRFIRDLLTDIQCPVLVVPQDYHTIEKIIFLYDGEPSSVHAVKMFSYLMDTMSGFEVEVLSSRTEHDSRHMPESRLMKEFMHRHYPHAHYQTLQGMPEDAILGHLKKEKKNVLVVLGAYRRGRMSRLFHPSMADVLMNHLNIPLFIAHAR